MKTGTPVFPVLENVHPSLGFPTSCFVYSSWVSTTWRQTDWWTDGPDL